MDLAAPPMAMREIEVRTRKGVLTDTRRAVTGFAHGMIVGPGTGAGDSSICFGRLYLLAWGVSGRKML